MAHQRSRRPGPFVPGLEALEDRCLLAVTVTANAATGQLLIRGGNGSNHIRIMDDGTAGVNNVKVVVNHRTLLPGITVTGVVVREGAGNDTVTYNLNGTLATGTSRNVIVNLGAGANAFAAKLRAGLNSRSNLSLQVNGGPLPDNISVSGTSGIGIANGASLNMDLTGGGGDDTISTNYRGLLVGTINLFEEGDDGNDLLENRVTLNSGSLGSYSAQVFGNAGDDTMTMNVRKLVASNPGTAAAVLNGGPGINTAVASIGVRLIRVEHHTMP
jgi:hypothetical protein